MADPLQDLTTAGVSIWLDDLGRPLLTSGRLDSLVSGRHVVGITSNPTIFANAISGSGAYDDQIADLSRQGASTEEALRLLTVTDVRSACDVLRPVFEASQGVDGRVSIEVDPHLADDTAGAAAQARQLRRLVDRPNVLIKIPATEAGLPAIAACLAEGISVNVTLIFSLQRYAEVVQAFLDGMERAKAAGHDLSDVVSVASLFVSRVDTEIDRRLDQLGTPEARALKGRGAIANARLVHQHFGEVFGGRRAAALAAGGARPQRPLWASTGVKDPAYDDTRYVTELVTAGVVNTMPQATLAAVAEHGEIRGDTIRQHYAEAAHVLHDLESVGVDYDDVMAVLEQQGLDKFADSWALVTAELDERLRRTQHKAPGTPPTALSTATTKRTP